MARFKAKTHKGLLKRVKITANGKVKRKASFGGHLMSNKSSKRRRRIRGMVLVSACDAARVRAALGAS